MDLDSLGAIKIKDGLFLGDSCASQDLEFIVSNKVTHIINTASGSVPDHWEPIGVKYLDYNWKETEPFMSEEVLMESSLFIEEANTLGGAVLIHSEHGRVRSVVLLCGFLMTKFKWSLGKTLDFMAYRRPDLSIDQFSISQLELIERNMAQKTSRWTELTDDIHVDSEELMMRNTYINAQSCPPTNYTQPSPFKDQSIRWADLQHKNYQPPKNKVENGFLILKSCLKHNRNTVLKVPVSHKERVLKNRQASAKREPVLAKHRPGRENQKIRANTDSAKPRNKIYSARPPSPLIKSNKIVQNIKKPTWK